MNETKSIEERLNSIEEDISTIKRKFVNLHKSTIASFNGVTNDMSQLCEYFGIDKLSPPAEQTKKEE